MPSKRKVELSPEPTPQTRRRSAKPATTTASASKRPRESVVATEERIRRTRRDEMAPSLDSQSSSVPSTNRARRVIHKEIIETDEVVVIHYEPPTGSKKGGESTAVVSSKTPIKAPSNPKSALKSANRRRSVVKIDLPPPEEPVEQIAPSSSTTLSKSNETVDGPHVALSSSLSDELEIVSVWNQCWDALYLCLTIIGPLFTGTILVCYFLGVIKQSQAIASIGVVYTLLFITIMGSYAIAILPFILISRVFTSFVAPHGSHYTTEEVNFYCRLTLLIAIVSGLIYYCIN